MTLSPRTPTIRQNQAASQQGPTPQSSHVMCETLLLRLPIRQDDQETLESQGRR